MSDEIDTATSSRLTCSICFEPVKHSKQLPCFHTFCRDCLEQYIRHSNTNVSVDGEGIIQCPQCRRTIPIPKNGVHGFPSSYFVMAHCDVSTIESGDLTCGICNTADASVGFCIECRKNLCIDCKQTHKINEATHHHHILIMGDGKKVVETVESCDKHPEQDLKFFCSKCREPCCIDCRQTTHYGHPALDIVDAAVIERERLTGMVDDLQLQLVKFKMAKDEAVAAKERMSISKDLISPMIESRKRAVVKKIQDMCDHRGQIIKDHFEARLKEIDEPYEEIMEDYDHLLRCSEEAEDVIRLSNALRTVTVSKEAEEVLLKYSSIEAKKINECGSIFATGIFPEQYLRNFCGLFSFENLTLKREFSFETDHFIEFSLIPVSETEAWVSYYTSEGSALVLYNSTGIKVDYIVMKPNGSSRVLKLGREFLVTLKHEKRLMIYRDRTAGLEDFIDVKYSPRGLTKTLDNKILLCASEPSGSSENALLVFTERGELVKEVTESNGNNIFIAPRYIAVNINGDICVSDKGASCVVILGKDYEVKARYIPTESINLRNSFCPLGICCDRFGRILVADGGNNKVHLLTAQGKFIRFILEEGDGINWPRLVEIGPGNKLWVVCRGKVQVYAYLSSE